MEQQHLRPPDTPRTPQGDSKHRLDERVDGRGEALAADAVTEGVERSGRKARLELRTTTSNSHDAAASPTHRASAASLAETLPPPPAYETAISLPLPSSSASDNPSSSTRRRCSHRHRSHRRDPSVSSTSSSLSDPTSDSEDPLNDLLRLTNSLLATSTSILASSTALQGSLSRLLRSPPRGEEGFSKHGKAMGPESEGEDAASTSSTGEEEEEPTAEASSRPASPSPAQSVEQSLRSELALSSSTSDELDRLGRDIERYDVQWRGRDPSSLFLGGNREARAERGRTMLVTAMAEGDGIGGLGLGASPAASRRREGTTAGPAGGMKRSASAAAELLGKLASSPSPAPRPASGMTRATSYAGGGLSAFLSSPSASSTPSSSKVTLDAPFPDPASPSTPFNNTLPPNRRSRRRTSPLSPVAPTSGPSIAADFSSSSPSPAPLSTLPEAHLSPRPALRRSPSTHDLRNPLPPSLSLAASLSTPSLLSSSAVSTPSPSSPARSTTTAMSTPRRPPAHSHRTNPSISLPRGSAALPTSMSFEDLDTSSSSATVGSPRTAGSFNGGEAASPSGARERLKALAGAGAGAGVEGVKGNGGGQGEEGKGGGSWWSWT